MFDAEKLLGEMMRGMLGAKLGGKRKRRKRDWSDALGGKTQLGLGALGIAIAAWEHLSRNKATATPAGVGQSQTAAATMAPPPAPIGSPSVAMPPPPPTGLPGLESTSDALPQASSNGIESATSATSVLSRDDTAKLLIIAMIAAAAADGAVDPDEHDLILERATRAGLDADGTLFLNQALAKPLNPEQLATQTPSELAAQVYASALVAITPDSEVENTFLNRLALALRLDVATRAQIHARIESDD